jgi:tetratricopeptide (TPR) repeat protein
MQFNDCANNHFDNGSYEDAMSCYARALSIMPNYSWAFCNRAAVQLALGNIVRPQLHPPLSCDSN